MMKLFEYAIIYRKRQTKDERESGARPQVVIVQDVKRTIAADEREVLIAAAREIPADYLDKLDCIDIAVRPF